MANLGESVFVYEICEGFRKGSELLYIPETKQLYKIKSKSRLCKRYTCYKSECNASAVVEFNNENLVRVPKVSAPHNHSTQEDLRGKLKLLSEIKNECANVSLKRSGIREVFDEVCGRGETSASVQFGKVRRQLINIRNSSFPKAPTSASEICAIFKNRSVMHDFGMSRYKRSEPFYRSTVIEPGFSYTIFMSPTISEEIRKLPDGSQKNYLLDGTFSVVPSCGYKQLCLIHFAHDDHKATVAGPGEINTTHLAADELDAINQSLELQCLVQEHVEISLYGNSSEFCATSFDSILCWPRTPRGTLAVLPCLDEFQGIQYDSTQNATRYCYPNGTWERYTSYDLCRHLPAPSTVPEFEPIVELPTIIYYVGYTLSLVSLTLAVLVFIYFKELRCLRNSIHANLFFTYIMSGLLWILTLSVQISMRTGLGGCIVLVTVFHFFTLTNFFWMLVEGLYLYMLVVNTFSGDNIRFNIYALIGWGGPAVFVAIWTIAKGVTTSFASEKIDTGCPWMHETAVDWIFQGPVCVVLIMNLIFLLRIMWVLITKLRSANTVETRQYRKAAKALLVLIPLFGITYLVVLAGPNENGVVSNIFAVIRAVLLSTQGFSVSLFYCFLNSEVRNALRHYVSRWQDERNIRLGQLRQSRRFTTKSNSQTKDYSPRTRTESISIRPLTSYYGKGKRESSVSSATTTTLLGQHPPMSLQRGSNGALHMLPTPRAISPLMKQGLDENAV